jgi:ATP-binding cassette, subfamily G (WHITE), member 2, PDR
MQAPQANNSGQTGIWGAQSIAGGIVAALIHSPQTASDVPSQPHPVGGDVRPDGTFDITEEQRDHIVALARSISRSQPGLARAISRASTTSVATRVDEPVNPFIDAGLDPELDPNSGKFSVNKWMKNVIALHQRDPERYPHRTAGVSWKRLNVYGYGTDTDFQADVANVWIKMFNSVKSLLGLGHKNRIAILNDFEGLVKAGEMLVVLGRPGRYVISLSWL